MSSLKNRPRRAVFLLAAEMVFNASIFSPEPKYGSVRWENAYSCNCLSQACGTIRWDKYQPEVKMYFRLMKPDEYVTGSTWWPPLPDGSWDYESRILALLLCAEMLRR